MSDKKDIVIPIGAPREDGGIPVIRSREDAEGNPVAELGVIHPLRNAADHPEAEHVRLVSRGGFFDVKPLAGGAGPAQVANDAYRNNFDNIFGPPKTRVPKYLN